MFGGGSRLSLVPGNLIRIPVDFLKFCIRDLVRISLRNSLQLLRGHALSGAASFPLD